MERNKTARPWAFARMVVFSALAVLTLIGCGKKEAAETAPPAATNPGDAQAPSASGPTPSKASPD